jgi:hypothetical protein
VARKIAGIMAVIEDTLVPKERMKILEKRKAKVEGVLAGADAPPPSTKSRRIGSEGASASRGSTCRYEPSTALWPTVLHSSRQIIFSTPDSFRWSTFRDAQALSKSSDRWPDARVASRGAPTAQWHPQSTHRRPMRLPPEPQTRMPLKLSFAAPFGIHNIARQTNFRRSSQKVNAGLRRWLPKSPSAPGGSRHPCCARHPLSNASAFPSMFKAGWR